MARPTHEEIETYMNITGASESLALQKLQEYGGNLHEAVNAFYGAEESYITSNQPPIGYPEPQRNEVRSNNETPSGHGLFPILSAARTFKPSLLFDPNYRRGIYSRLSAAGSSLLSPQRPAAPVPAAEPNYNLGPLPHARPPIVITGNGHIPAGYDTLDLDNHLEDEILQTVIRDSLRDTGASSSSAGHWERPVHLEEDDLARAVLLSLEMAEKEEANREQQMRDYRQGLGIDRRPKSGSSSNQNEAQKVEEDEEEEQQLRKKSIHRSSNHPEMHKEEDSWVVEWGGISFKELDESLMLEKTLFGSTSGGASGGASSNFLSSSQLKSGPENSAVSDHQPISRSLSPTHQANHLLKEQQHKKYQASLLVDKQKQEESNMKMLNEVEQGRASASKIASLSCEPASDDENAVTLLVRMPNGSRSGRRFLKSDKLQLLFDFVDIGGEVKSGSYRVVRSYPRRAFNLAESSLTLTELGLTNKQEVLFLELI